VELNINAIGKCYRDSHWGLRDVSLSLTPGVLGLIGPNGAGKSTLMRILATVTQPSRGTVTWNGTDISKDPDTLRGRLGYLPQDFGVYPNLSAVEFLGYLAAARGLTGSAARRRIEALLELVNLTDARNRRLCSLSGGMKQRVGIAQALLNDPYLLIVDEPTAGLDPEERLRFRNLVTDLAGDRIVILSSHIVSDIEAAATSIAVLDRGRLLRHAAPEHMLRSVSGKVWQCLVPSDGLQTFRQSHTISNSTRTPEGVRVRLIADQQPTPDSEPTAPALEDAYLYLLSGAVGECGAS